MPPNGGDGLYAPAHQNSKLRSGSQTFLPPLCGLATGQEPSKQRDALEAEVEASHPCVENRARTLVPREPRRQLAQVGRDRLLLGVGDVPGVIAPFGDDALVDLDETVDPDVRAPD